MRFLVLFVMVLTAGCGRGDVDKPPAPTFPHKVEARGLHNVYRLTDNLLSGSSPEGEEGFRSLKELGVRTVLSVDGARPDVAAAKKYGLRYVHLPTGYDGIASEQVLRMARAVRDLPGAVYVHCHHGKHRGPAAAAAIHLCLDEKCTVEQAIAEMETIGTDPHYTGLYAVPKNLVRPTKADLDKVPAEFPETSEVSALAQFMVRIDERWENLKQVRSAGWRAPKNNPDVDPPHEALQLVEQYREAARASDVLRRPEDFRRRLTEAEAAAKELETILRSKKIDDTAAAEAFRKGSVACSSCHARYRDVREK